MLQTLTPNDLLYLMNALRGYTTYPALMSSIQQNPALLSSFNMLGNFFSQLPTGIQQLANGVQLMINGKINNYANIDNSYCTGWEISLEMVC